MQLSQLGPYRIEKPLGKGGMGSVYAATDTRTGQRVAIKALTPHLALAEGFRERFEAEIESLKTLKHDGIVRLYGYGEQDGVLFYSMELVEGISLEDELKAGRRFNWREVTNIAIQLSLALKHAHDHGIVHRDIKPANILLADDDRVKLADFGIARLFGTTSLTTAGGVLGTADYMSPEQADGRPVSARCDQYSLGGVMYALLAGRPPFRATNLPQMLQLQRFAHPEPVRRYAPDTPEQLERVIGQLLSKNPADRFPNTQVLARHLQAMALALSRPAHDDFSLSGEGSDAHAHHFDDDSLAIDVTQAEVEPRSEINPSAGQSLRDKLTSSQDAPTLAADDADAPVTGKSISLAPVPEPVKQPPIERAARFTTIEEEEEARRRAQHQRSWIVVAAQLATLSAVLVGITALGIYLARPPKAEDLYARISTHIENDEESLANVEGDIQQFLSLYPDDARSAELRRYQESIELDRLERKLQREARTSGAADGASLPAEELYLKAAAVAQTSPDESLRLLKSLVALYGVDATTSDPRQLDTAKEKPSAKEQGADRTAAIVQLAKRRLASLSADLVKRQDRAVADLKRRLAVAHSLPPERFPDAMAMYQAIIDLHEHDEWAAEPVKEARRRLSELQSAERPTDP